MKAEFFFFFFFKSVCATLCFYRLLCFNVSVNQLCFSFNLCPTCHNDHCFRVLYKTETSQCLLLACQPSCFMSECGSWYIGYITANKINTILCTIYCLWVLRLFFRHAFNDRLIRNYGNLHRKLTFELTFFSPS